METSHLFLENTLLIFKLSNTFILYYTSIKKTKVLAQATTSPKITRPTGRGLLQTPPGCSMILSLQKSLTWTALSCDYPKWLLWWTPFWLFRRVLFIVVTTRRRTASGFLPDLCSSSNMRGLLDLIFMGINQGLKQ